MLLLVWLIPSSSSSSDSEPLKSLLFWANQRFTGFKLCNSFWNRSVFFFYDETKHLTEVQHFSRKVINDSVETHFLYDHPSTFLLPRSVEQHFLKVRHTGQYQPPETFCADPECVTLCIQSVLSQITRKSQVTSCSIWNKPVHHWDKQTPCFYSKTERNSCRTFD